MCCKINESSMIESYEVNYMKRPKSWELVTEENFNII